MTNQPPDDRKWYVVYTRSRAEKKVYTWLTKQDIRCYLPLQKKLRKWKDRKKWIEVPLIPGYCFVFINIKEQDLVLKSENIVCYITFDGIPATIPSFQIEQLKQMLKQSDFEVTVLNENFIPGQRVEIIKGPLTGIQGELIKCHGRKRFIIRIEHIKNILSVEVPCDNLTALPEKII